MNKVLCGIVLCGSLIGAAQAGGFDGFYVAAKAGSNNSSAFGQSHSNGFVGGEAGYNWAGAENMVIGADVWADNHRQSVTARDFGVDAKLGNVSGMWMYYVKLGVAATRPGSRIHYGLGLEYKFNRNWGGLAEWTGDTKSKDATTYTNNNYVIGVTYHF